MYCSLYWNVGLMTNHLLDFIVKQLEVLYSYRLQKYRDSINDDYIENTIRRNIERRADQEKNIREHFDKIKKRLKLLKISTHII